MHLHPSAFDPSAFDEAVFIGLGSNLGNRHDHLRDAVNHISAAATIRCVACSSFVQTLPWGKTEQPSFLNGAVEIRTSLSPMALLKFLKHGERLLGRTPSVHWGPRSIDMDILLFGERIINETDLTVPHAELRNRAFALAPLIELQPMLRHPGDNGYLKDVLEQLQ